MTDPNDPKLEVNQPARSRADFLADMAKPGPNKGLAMCRRGEGDLVKTLLDEGVIYNWHGSVMALASDRETVGSGFAIVAAGLGRPTPGGERQ